MDLAAVGLASVGDLAVAMYVSDAVDLVVDSVVPGHVAAAVDLIVAVDLASIIVHLVGSRRSG